MPATRKQRLGTRQEADKRVCAVEKKAVDACGVAPSSLYRTNGRHLDHGRNSHWPTLGPRESVVSLCRAAFRHRAVPRGRSVLCCARASQDLLRQRCSRSRSERR
ncbi:hypothetical protein MRX96_021520 [Rhipicephalus microplus]